MAGKRLSAAAWAAAAVLLACAPAGAVVELQALGWQSAARGGPAKGRSVDSLTLPVNAKLDGRLAGRVRLLNRGPQAEEGILLRYTLEARVHPAEGGPSEWSLPFVLDTRRVPRIGPNKIVETRVDVTTMLALYLAKLKREGWWLDRLKLDVLLEPREDEPKRLQILSCELPVSPPSGAPAGAPKP